MSLQRRFYITKRIIKGTSVLGYVLTDTEGNIKSLEKEKVGELAFDGYIENAKAQRDNKTNTFIIKGVGCELKKLPSISVGAKEDNRCVITHRIISGKNTLGYRVKYNNNYEEEITVSKAVELTKLNRVMNAKIQKFGEEYKIRGTKGAMLNTLPVIKK